MRILRKKQQGPKGSVVVIAIVMTTIFAADFLRGEMPEDAVLPEGVKAETFTALKGQSPFLRSIGLSKSLIVTGVVRIEEEVYATLFDLDARESYLVGKEVNREGWQLVSMNGDPSDLDTFTARIKVAGNQVVSIRYQKLPPTIKKSSSSSSSSSRGGGYRSSHSGDPRVLSQAQKDDAKRGAQNYKEGFGADGYDRPPPETVAKLSRLSFQQRETINLKMHEYRNRGLGSRERVQIYEKLIDRSLQGR